MVCIVAVAVARFDAMTNPSVIAGIWAFIKWNTYVEPPAASIKMCYAKAGIGTETKMWRTSFACEFEMSSIRPALIGSRRHRLHGHIVALWNTHAE